MSDQLDVWVADLRHPVEAELPPEDLKRARSFLRAEAAASWTASRRALRRVLSGYLGEEPAAIEIVREDGGKPRLEREGLEFNLSHSGDLAVIAVAPNRQVGVDVEKVEPARDLLALAERALGPEDAARVREAGEGERAAVFYESWVRHEARVKCLGSGLAGPSIGTAVAARNLDVAPGYAAAVAVLGAEVGPVRIRILDDG